MEQQNQQPIQEKMERKPPARTNWKYLVAVAAILTLLIGGTLIYFFSNQTETPLPDQIPITRLVKVYSHGGLCPTGECRSEVTINSDGTFVYIPDLNTKVGQGVRIEGSISTEKLSSLKQAIQQSNFQEIKENKFTGTCPTAYDGEEIVYIFYRDVVDSLGEEIASCTAAIDYTSNLFRVLDEIINEEVHGTTKGKDGCVITGCGNQICSDQEVITTCEALPEYVCYRNAVCERQSNGACGWTQTSELTQCLQAKSAKQTLIDTSTWQTYRNDEFGFEVRYPWGWEKEPGHQEPNEVSFVDQRLVGDIAVKYAQIFVNAKKVSLEFIRTWSPGIGKIRIIGGIPVMEIEDPHSKEGAYESMF